MNNKQRRQHFQQRNKKEKLVSGIIWGGIGLAVLAILGVIVWQGIKPAAGDAVPIMKSDPHLPADSDPGQYNSDPPTSGLHYATEAQAGFFDENIYMYPAGYLVHNLEHGYVIIWYNCDLLDGTGCAELESQIRTVMDDLGGVKLIAYPWNSIDVPVAMTSWGRIHKFEIFDVEQAKAFYQSNLNRAPEPDAP